MTLAPSIYWLIPARFILGFASGLSSVVVPVYLGEISPPAYRGTIGETTMLMLHMIMFFIPLPLLCRLLLTVCHSHRHPILQCSSVSSRYTHSVAISVCVDPPLVQHPFDTRAVDSGVTQMAADTR